MYFGRTNLKGLGVSQSDVLIGTGLLTTLFPNATGGITKLVESVYPQPAQAAAGTGTAAATQQTQYETQINKGLLYGGIALAVLALGYVIVRR